MAGYRLLSLDQHGNILHRREIEAADDTLALKAASERADPHLGCEVWDQGRKIAKLPPKIVPGKDV